MKKRSLLPGAFLAFLLSACSNEHPITEEEKEKTFPVTSPVVMDTLVTREYVADIHAVQNVEIRARIKGFIDHIYVDEGQTVKKDQLLFNISRQEFKEDLLKANAQLKNAIAEYKMAEVDVTNTQSLVSKNIVSASELQMAKAKLEAAQARIEEAQSAISSAQLNISFTSIRAPFEGTINRLPLKTGSLVNEGTLLTTLSNDREVYAYFNLSEKQYLTLLKNKEKEKDKTVKLIMADGQVFPTPGIIETAESEIDKNTGTLAFRARFKNKDQLLRHGSSGKIQLTNKLHNALLIPQKATFDIQENTYVYVLDSNDVVSTRSITIKQRLPQLYVVESGLSPEDRFIYEGLQNVKAGDKIIPHMKPIREIMQQLAVQ